MKLGLAFDRGEEIGKPAPDSDAVRAYYPTESSLRLTGGYDFAPRGKWSAIELRGLAGEYRLVLDRDRRATSSSTRRIDRSDVDAKDASVRLTGYRPLGRGRIQAGIDITSRFDLHALTEGIDLETGGRESARSRDASIEEARRIDAALFASHEVDLWPAWRLSAGVRGDRVVARNRGGYFGDHSANHFAPSGFAAMTGGPWSNLTATIQGGVGFRDPTLSDRYFRGPSGRGFVTGNPALDPERSRQLDLAIQWSRNDTFVGLYAYDYTIEDLIERYRSESNFFFRNRGEAVVRGIELEGHAPVVRGFSLEWTAAKSQGEGSGGIAIDDIAPPNVSVTLRWAGPAGFLSFRGARSWSHDDPGPTETERDGYSTLDLSAGYRFSKAMEVRMIARNLTNEIYFGSADPQSVITPGRSILLTLSGRFSP